MNDSAQSIQLTSDGGYIVAGKTDSFGAGGIDLWVLKLRPEGAVEWQKTYGGTSHDWSQSIQPTSDEGYIVAGGTTSFGAGEDDLWVLKLRPDGTVEWQKTYGVADYNCAHSIQQTSDGGYIVAGETMSCNGAIDFWVLKLRPDGTVEWQKTYGGVDYDRADSIQQTNDGGYIVAGGTTSFGAGKDDLWVLKLGHDGTVEWQKSYGGANSEWGNFIQQTSDGGYIVAGETLSFGTEGVDFWVIKLKSDGTIEWENTFGGAGKDRAHSIKQTNDGGYIVAGETWADAWVLKLKLDGTVEWQKAYGGANYDMASSIQQTHEGGYIVSGYTASFYAGGEATPDLWVLKLRPFGSINPSCNFMRDTRIFGKVSNAKVNNTYTNPKDTNINPRDSSATVFDTNISADILCQSIPAEKSH